MRLKVIAKYLTRPDSVSLRYSQVGLKELCRSLKRHSDCSSYQVFFADSDNSEEDKLCNTWQRETEQEHGQYSLQI